MTTRTERDAAATPALLDSFRTSYRDLLRYLAQRTNSTDEARDLAHDTWLRLAELAAQGSLPEVPEGSEARAYIFAMARNLSTDRQRRDGVASRHAAAFPSREHASPDATEALMYRQAICAIEAALGGLPERARQVFLRHRVQGEDQSVLAAEYGVTRNMIERDMMRAMDCVQAAMERWHGVATSEARQPARIGRRRSLAALLGIGGLAATGGWHWWREAMPQWQEALSTGQGRLLRQALPDGSVLTLDAQSRVQASYYAAHRVVRLLAGAVYLDVVRDAERPFVVETTAAPDAPRVRVTVLGTRFGVERLPDAGVEVQVESGRVRVETLDADGRVRESRTLSDGESLRVRAGPPGAATAGVFEPTGAAADVASWRHGVLVLSDMPLSAAVSRLSRYLPRPVEVDPRVAGLRLSGQVRIAQSEDFLRALPDIVAVRSVLSGDRWTIGPRSR
ncbi:sigma-70 family RNA polymerase sigma factor [Variovorax sp. RHLX14]|uniref:sigma-70 family RNA polymerase sigma factor n=1 Tax=Variovorax sp. RHLX14 TaxID=1259731 RepID=UPI003F462B05